MKKMYQIKWFDMKGEKLVVRSFNGAIIAEDADSVTFAYRKKPLTIAKANCTMWKWTGIEWALAN
jgi:hypothetical protein